MANFKSWNSFSKFSQNIARHQRYIRDRESESFLRAVAASCKGRVRIIGKGLKYWRAQLGNGWFYEKQIDDEVPAPYSQERMLPLRDRAFEGRVNPKGIPYLYLSTTRDAALSEVRPWIGSYVSVAQFEIGRDLRIIDCALYHDKTFLFFPGEPKPKNREKAVWAAIDRAFSMPVTRAEDTADYAATQTIAELFRQNGYDGVGYKSAFGASAVNLALFDLDCAHLLNCSLFEVKKLQFDFREAATPYFVTKYLKSGSVRQNKPPKSSAVAKNKRGKKRAPKRSKKS